MKQKKLLSIILVVALFFTFTACGKKTEKSSSELAQEKQLTVVSEDGKWLGKGGCYILNRLSENDNSVMRGSLENLIFSNFEELSDEDGYVLFDSYICDYAVTKNEIWCISEVGMVNDEYNQGRFVTKLDFSGQELLRFDVSTRADSLAVSTDAVYLYDSINYDLTVYNTQGEELGHVALDSAQLEDFSGNLCTGGDGSVWLLNDVENRKTLYPINLSTMNLGSAYTLPENQVALYKGTSEHPFLLSTQEELTYLDPVSDTMSNILYWDECGIYNGELHCLIPAGDSFLCLSATGLSRIRPGKPDEIDPRIRLTLGIVSRFDGGAELASFFNATNDEYRVEIEDYSSGDKLCREDAQAKLNTALMSGNGPDLIMLSDMDSLHNTSTFIDLYPLLDADQEIKRDDFYGLKAIENNGRLLLAPSCLMISTFGALPEVVGDRTGWTWDEYFEIEKKLPAGGIMSSYLSADFFLQSSLELYASHAIDWVNGTCSFDTPEFVRILEAAKKGYDPNCPKENPYYIDEISAMLSNGRTILESACFFDVDSFMECDIMNGRELSYIGWPTPDGSCGSVFYISGVSISANTDCVDGCWKFAKYVMKSTYAYKPTFEKALQEAATRKEAKEGEQMLTMTQSQADRYRKLMETISVAASDSCALNNIVFKEAGAMFAGYKTPEETAKLIQSRMSIYVAERK